MAHITRGYHNGFNAMAQESECPRERVLVKFVCAHLVGFLVPLRPQFQSIPRRPALCAADSTEAALPPAVQVCRPSTSQKMGVCIHEESKEMKTSIKSMGVRCVIATVQQVHGTPNQRLGRIEHSQVYDGCRGMKPHTEAVALLSDIVHLSVENSRHGDLCCGRVSMQ